jgi:diacylglycerol kinase (ATP)
MSSPADSPDSGLTRWLRGFAFAFAGLAHLVKSQRNARVHVAATGLVVWLGVWTDRSRLEWLALVLAIGLVWTTEAFNTSVELVVDLVSPDPHPLAKRAKDVAAGGVLLAALASVVIAALVFGPALLDWPASQAVE